MPPFKNTTGLRNRYRVTNKSRLRIIKENLDAENVVVDEDEERARVVSTAGVDAEDANEHHLQAALAPKREKTHIPVPDADGVVDNYVDLYPSGKWREPTTYLKFSETPDDCLFNAIADGFSYFMDERDSEWLEKNNQVARGEGTSTQAALSASGTTTRSGTTRSAKHKGKEPDPTSPVAMTDEEFELVMGVFEKVTHDSTPFLHVCLQQGMTLPPFADYSDIFSSELPPSMFATCMVPPNVPHPSTLVHMARTVYPYWRDRRMERDGHRIIPALNFDESDIKNESYVCFRRRDVKAIRKTRTTQISSTDKLLRLKGEDSIALEIANQVLAREYRKRDAAAEARRTWGKRMIIADLKRKYSALGGKEDDEILFDKERVPKRARNSETPAMQLRLKKAPMQGSISSPVPTEPYLRPRDRTNMIQSMIEDHMKRQKERDHHWDDLLDNPFQSDPLPWTEQLFRSISVPSIPSISSDTTSRTGRPMRLRVGRGGRLHLDRRTRIPQSRHALEHYLRHKPSFPDRDDDLSKAEQDERAWRTADRWKFDSDAPPLAFDGGADEENRELVDDYQPKFIRHTLQLVQEQDHSYFQTDTRPLFSEGSSGFSLVSPFRLAQPGQLKRDLPIVQRAGVALSVAPNMPPSQTQTNGSVQLSPPASSNGVSIPPQTPIRKMAPPAAPQQVRVVSSDGFRATSSSLAGAVTPLPSSQAPNPVNGNTTTGVIAGTNGAVPQVTLNGQATDTSVPFGNEVQQPLGNMVQDSSEVGVGLPSRPKSQNQHPHIQIANAFPHGVTNGSYNGYSNGIPNGYVNHVPGQYNVLSMQQTQNLKVAFAGVPPNQALAMQASLPGAQRPAPGYPAQMQNGIAGNGVSGNMTSMNMLPVNLNLKLPAARQMQLAAANGVGQRVLAAPNQDLLQSPNNLAQALPNRTAPTNGLHTSPIRPGQSPSHQYIGQDRVASMNGHHFAGQSLSPHVGSPALMHTSPIMSMQSPVPSPSPQHQVLGMNGVQSTGF